MSGGSFDYAYIDAQTLAREIGEMAEYAESRGYPDGVVGELEQLAASLGDAGRNHGLLRTVEWEASDDITLDRAVERIGSDD